MANDLVGVLNALALVGFRRSLGSDVGGELADLLLVDAVDDDLVLRRDFDGDAIDLFDGDQVGVTQVHDELVALFAGTIADAVDLEFLLFSPIKQLLFDSQRGIVITGQSQLLIKDKSIRLTHMQGFQTVLEFFSILYELSISSRYTLISNQYSTEDTIRTSKSRRIAKVCDYLEKNFDEPIKLCDAAKLVNMSESAFSHFFRKKTNYTFIDYITNLRITKACQLLSDTTYTVAEICYTCGFNNLSNFIRTFKKKKAMTPNEYRVYLQKMLIKY